MVFKCFVVGVCLVRVFFRTLLPSSLHFSYFLSLSVVDVSFYCVVFLGFTALPYMQIAGIETAVAAIEIGVSLMLCYNCIE